MAWTAGAGYNTSGDWNFYDSYSKGETPTNPYTGFLAAPDTSGSYTSNSSTNYGQGVGAGIGQYNNEGTSGGATSGAISGAASGYAQGGWVGAIVGGISGWFGGKDKEKKGKQGFEQQMKLTMAPLEYAEQIRQLKMKEQSDALANYTANTPAAPTFNYGNGLLSGGTAGAFAPKPATQPVVNPEQNSYGLLRG